MIFVIHGYCLIWGIFFSWTGDGVQLLRDISNNNLPSLVSIISSIFRIIWQCTNNISSSGGGGTRTRPVHIPLFWHGIYNDFLRSYNFSVFHECFYFIILRCEQLFPFFMRFKRCQCLPELLFHCLVHMNTLLHDGLILDLWAVTKYWSGTLLLSWLFCHI